MCRLIFASLVPPAVLMARANPPAIVADAAVDVALPPCVTQRGQRQSCQAEALRRHLIDFKCVYGGGTLYRCARARDERGGAVAQRAHDEWGVYTRSARALDTRFYPAPQTPVMDRLQAHGQVRVMAFGAYGEASPDVHHVLAAAATRHAQSTWRSSGARTQSEAYGYWLQAYRRDMGMTVVREMARHRLNRVPFVGVERRFVQERVRAHVVHGDQGRLPPLGQVGN